MPGILTPSCLERCINYVSFSRFNGQGLQSDYTVAVTPFMNPFMPEEFVDMAPLDLRYF